MLMDEIRKKQFNQENDSKQKKNNNYKNEDQIWLKKS